MWENGCDNMTLKTKLQPGYWQLECQPRHAPFFHILLLFCRIFGSPSYIWSKNWMMRKQKNFKNPLQNGPLGPDFTHFLKSVLASYNLKKRFELKKFTSLKMVKSLLSWDWKCSIFWPILIAYFYGISIFRFFKDSTKIPWLNSWEFVLDSNNK